MQKPLAETLRPALPDDLVGQEHLWGKTATLRRLVEDGKLWSAIFWGPPGVGKTSLAGVIAEMVGGTLYHLSAVQCGVKELRAAFEDSKALIAAGKEPGLLFLDEIHRLNKTQQDVLLQALEQGYIRFVGATSEDPSFSVNPAVLSRCLLFEFKRLALDDLKIIIARACKRAAETRPDLVSAPTLSDEAIVALAASSAGDSRKVINAVEALIASAESGECITLESLKQKIPNIARGYSRTGSDRYELISAMIKSIRASAADGAIYYLAAMLEGGEDPRYIARRLVIAASEDIGNANPTALLVAAATEQASKSIGMPEIRINLAQAVTYLAASPKSNAAYLAINAAMADIKENGIESVPEYLCNGATQYQKQRGYGKRYVYPHDDPEGARHFSYLPDSRSNARFYRPKPIGAEKQLGQILERQGPIRPPSL